MDENITRTKVWILILGGYLIFFLYKLFSVAASPESFNLFGDGRGLALLKYRDIWLSAFNSTLPIFPFVLALLLIVTIFGVDKTFSVFARFLPRPFNQFLLKPIDIEALEEPETQRGNESSLNTKDEIKGLGYQLHLDYHESIKRAYNNTIMQYSRSFYFSLVFAVVGFCLIAYALIFKMETNPNWPAVFVSAVIQSVPALFFYLSDRARRQMTHVFGDLRKDNEVSRAYELLDTIEDVQRKELLKEEIIRHTLISARGGMVSKPTAT
jgi:hypothetical protein